MLCAELSRIATLTALAAFLIALSFGVSNTAVAQTEPPITIPAGGPPAFNPDSLYFNGWHLYPTLTLSAINSNNFFLSPTSKISGWEFGLSPAMTAEWSNGIHATTIYGNVQRLEYPTDNELNATDGEATVTQRYSPLRDLTFTFIGDYIHQRIQSGLIDSIPTQTQFTGTVLLPDGNTQHPNGTITSPTGQVVGQVAPIVTATPFSLVNPFDQYTGTASVQKLFTDGIVTLGATLQRVNYVNAGTADYDNTTFTEDSAFWLGPVFYLYSNGTFNIHSAEENAVPITDTISPGSNTTSYRAIGGLGTRQFGLFRASAYLGYQGSDSSISGVAGGNVYGAALTYYPTSAWTISAHVDETTNLAPGGASPTNLAVSVPGISPIQVSTSSSTEITSTTLQSSYRVSPQLSLFGTFGYTHVNFVGTTQWKNSFLADASVQYDMWKSLKLTWEYQYSAIVSDVPLTTANRNMITMSAMYSF